MHRYFHAHLNSILLRVMVISILCTSVAQAQEGSGLFGALAKLLAPTAEASVLIDPPIDPILRIEAGEHTSAIRSIATDEQGRWLATASEDKSVRVWNTADGRLLSTLRPPIGLGIEGKLYAVAMSPDGATVAAAGHTLFNQGKINTYPKNAVSIYVFDRASGRLLRRLSGLSNVVNQLVFSPNGQWLAATILNGGVRVFDAANGQLLAEDHYAGQSFSLDFRRQMNGDARLLSASIDGQLRLYRFNGQALSLLVKRAAPGGKQPIAARFSPDGQSIAVGFLDTNAVNVLDGDSLALRYAPDTTGLNKNSPMVAWSRDGKALFASGVVNQQGQLYIRRWTDAGKGGASDWPVAGNYVSDMATLPNGRLAFSAAPAAWSVLDAMGHAVVTHAPVMVDFNNSFNSLKLSVDGTQVRFEYEKNGKSSATFDSLRRTFVPVEAANLALPILSATGLSVTDWDNLPTPRLNGVVLPLQAGEKSRSFALLPNGDGLVLGSEFLLRATSRNGAYRWFQMVPGMVLGVNISRDGRWVVAAYGDGTIRWHRMSDGAEQLAFYPHPDKKRWVLWTPSGYYDASPGAEDLIGWHLNRGKDDVADFFPASRFRSQFNRPDVIAKIFESGNEADALQLANTEAGRKSQAATIVQVLPPVVDIVSPQEGTTVSTSSITLQYSARTPKDAPVSGLRVRVNGLLVTHAESGSPTATETGSVREITLPIPTQDSEIQLFAENRNGISMPAVLHVTWGGVKTASKADVQFKPKLYVLAVGVSKYANPAYNLGLADKDATDFVRVFQKQKGLLYSDVQVRLLTNDKASKDEVLDGLEWLKREVTARDVGVMFLAGHGMNDNTGSYYFLPHNVDPKKLLRTGVAQNDIKMTLNALAGKAVFFVDTCHAGNALGTARTRSVVSNIEAFVNELTSAENGVVVFTASTGRQLSQEDDSWGNGAFTKALVEGLSGKADYQKNGKITHKGLDYYVSERVKELTNGEQSPTSIAPLGVTDFPIAVVR